MDERKRLTVPPQPTPEELAEWRALVARVEAGDESGLIPWEEVAADLGLPSHPDH